MNNPNLIPVPMTLIVALLLELLCRQASRVDHRLLLLSLFCSSILNVPRLVNFYFYFKSVLLQLLTVDHLWNLGPSLLFGFAFKSDVSFLCWIGLNKVNRYLFYFSFFSFSNFIYFSSLALKLNPSLLSLS